MIEYTILVLVVLLAGTLTGVLGINAAWLVIPIALLTIPSVFAMFTGSPYLPTDRETLKRMLEFADIQKGEKTADLGCGDGRLVRAAAQKGAVSTGYEISIFLYLIARFMGGDIHYQNFWKADLREMDVVFIYLEKRFLPRFEREIWPHLKPGCRVISNTFALPSIPPTASDGYCVYRYEKV